MNDDARTAGRPRPAALEAGRVIDGRYRLTGKLGEGGMGEV